MSPLTTMLGDGANGSLLPASLHIVPEDFRFIPRPELVALAVHELRTMLPKANAEPQEYKQAIVIGGLIYGKQEILCPSCGATQTTSGAAGFCEMLTIQSAEEIDVEMPCCKSLLPLAALDLRPYTKFARFDLEVFPVGHELSDAQMDRLGKILGCELVQVIDRHEED